MEGRRNVIFLKISWRRKSNKFKLKGYWDLRRLIFIKFSKFCWKVIMIIMIGHKLVIIFKQSRWYLSWKSFCLKSWLFFGCLVARDFAAGSFLRATFHYLFLHYITPYINLNQPYLAHLFDINIYCLILSTTTSKTLPCWFTFKT